MLILNMTDADIAEPVNWMVNLGYLYLVHTCVNLALLANASPAIDLTALH